MDDFFFKIIDWIMSKIVLPLAVLCLIGIIIALPFLIYGCAQESKKPTFELKKDEWECKEATSWTTMVLVGKVMVPQRHTRCILWGER